MRCRINTRRTERARQAAQGGDSTVRVMEASRKGCVFCPENLESMTPRFPEQLIGEGRIRVGTAVLFPNLYPFGEHHAIAVFSGEHSLSLDSFSPRIIHDCLRACVEYLTRVRGANPEVRYGSINWNYMPPAGGSIVHPHLQVVADRRPTHFQERLIQCSEAYHRKYGSKYWDDLIETETKLQERLIHKGDSITWIASYAPHGNNDVMGVFHQLSSIGEMEERSLQSLSIGISRLLRGYWQLGAESLNMSLLSGPLDSPLDYYALNLRSYSRPSLEEYYTSDCGFMEKVHLENVVESKPEEVAKRIRMCFNGAE